MFYLTDHPDATLRLKSFSSRSNTSGKATISITVETEDPYQLAYALKTLGEVQTGQKKTQRAKAKSTRPKALASDRPLLQLPAPEDD
jgi:hypothetical protein